MDMQVRPTDGTGLDLDLQLVGLRYGFRDLQDLEIPETGRCFH
jgi:hypothetical protein